MTQQRKKLIEVAIPLEAINKGCEEDKNRKTGHIRNLHKWFAPMPLPAWRAMIFASLVDDPAEYLPTDAAAQERTRLFGIIEKLSAFGSYKDNRLMAEARAEITRAVDGRSPLLVDPFCGGGSTILEAQRLGLTCLASDLNPVPTLITTVLCRVAPMFDGQAPVCKDHATEPIGGWGPLDGLKTDVRHYADRVRSLAYETLQSRYPNEGDAVPYAYRWAWSVASPDPSAKGRYTPLVSDWWLSRHKNTRAWIQATLQGDEIRFVVRTEGTPPKGTTGRTSATCLYTGTPIPLEYIRSEGRAGRLRQTLIAIASRRGDETIFSSPNETQLGAASSVPPVDNVGIVMPEAALGFRVQQYGIANFLKLFTPRQAHALAIFAHHVRDIHSQIEADANEFGLPDDVRPLEDGGSGARAYADAVTAVLGLCVGKMAQSNSIVGRWFIDPRNGSGKATPAFDRHAIPMVWDFVESNPFGGSVGDWCGPVLETLLRAFDLHASNSTPAVVTQSDARLVSQALTSGAMLATDPPYYANIGYADLSDFFYLWLREALRPTFPKLFATVATPKSDELIATPFRHGGNANEADKYFRTGFADVFGSLSIHLDSRFPMMIVYAIKQAEETDGGVRSTGWEVFLGGLLDAGVSVVATWPVRTTTDTRMISIGTNSLASAVVVIGRRRRADALSVSRAQFIRELRAELPNSLVALRAANIAPVDMAQAAIGPGMAVFSRYRSVIEADGKLVSVGEALRLINQALDETQVEQESDFDADSRWALTWFEQSGFGEGDYGVAEQLSKSKNTSVAGLVDAKILASGRGKVRLLKPNEMPADWDPSNDSRLTAWEMVHQLIRALESGGEGAAAILVAKLGAASEVARELCYRLYAVCERKKRAPEALSYNGLVLSWPEISRIAQAGFRHPAAEQTGLFADE